MSYTRLYIEKVPIAFYSGSISFGSSSLHSGYAEDDLVFFWSCAYRRSENGQLRVPAPCAEIYLAWKSGTEFVGLKIETIIRLARDVFAAEERALKIDWPETRPAPP